MKKGLIAAIAIVLITVFTIYKMPSANEEELPKQKQTTDKVELPNTGYHAPRLSLPSLDGQIYF